MLYNVAHRVVENQTGKTWCNVRSILQETHVITCRHPDGTIQQRTELTPEQKAIVSALNFDKPLWHLSLYRSYFIRHCLNGSLP